MAAYGADPTALETLAQQMNKAAATLDHIASQLGARVQHAQWRGHHAAEFRSRWTHSYHPVLQAAHNEFASAALQLITNARDQRATSSADGGNLPTAGIATASVVTRT